MRNKLVLIFEQSIGSDIKIVANNERDLMEYLSEHCKFTNMEIDSDNYLSYKTIYGTELIQLNWVKEV